ncbi:MAG: thioredoxin [Bacteroidota bacterium]
MSFDVHNFETEVIQRSYQIPVLVDFWAEWCAPCRMLSPVLEQLAGRSIGEWVLAKVNTEEHPDVAATYGIRSIPNVKLFYGGKVVAEFVGALPENLVLQWLKKNLPSRNQSKVEEARVLIAEGRIAEAQPLLETILSEEPDNQQAKVLLARTYLFANPARAEQLAEEVDDPQHLELSEAVKTLARLITLESDPEQLPDSPTKQQYLGGIADLKSQQFEDALEKFIAVIRSNRYYDDDGSRKACIAIFKFLGEEHTVTQKYRREFSSALYM